MFQIIKEEFKEWRSQFVTSKSDMKRLVEDKEIRLNQSKRKQIGLLISSKMQLRNVRNKAPEIRFAKKNTLSPISLNTSHHWHDFTHFIL